MRRTLSTNGHERRAAHRYSLTLPVELKAATGYTRNVSSIGVLFEVGGPGSLPEGRDFGFRLVLRAGRLRCRGRVVRMEQAGSRCLVASTIDEWQIESPGEGAIVKVTAAIKV